MQNSLIVINYVRTIIIGSMTVRAENTLKYKFQTLDSTTPIIETDSITLRIGSVAKHRCNTFSSAVHITVELHICTCLQ